MFKTCHLRDTVRHKNVILYKQVEENGMTQKVPWGNNSGRFGKSSQKLPVCCIALIVINVSVFLLEVIIPSAGIWMKEQGCFGVVYLLYDNDYYRLLTSAFLHADIEHVANNMILLYFSGEIVERSLGRFRFLLLYLGAALCGNLLSAAYELSTGGFYNSIGASGAVFGVTGALLLLVVCRRGSAGEITLQRLLISVALSFYAGYRNASVNNAAHLGGIVSGFILCFLLNIIPRIKKRR